MPASRILKEIERLSRVTEMDDLGDPVTEDRAYWLTILTAGGHQFHGPVVRLEARQGFVVLQDGANAEKENFIVLDQVVAVQPEWL